MIAAVIKAFLSQQLSNVCSVHAATVHIKPTQKNMKSKKYIISLSPAHNDKHQKNLQMAYLVSQTSCRPTLFFAGFVPPDKAHLKHPIPNQRNMLHILDQHMDHRLEDMESDQQPQIEIYYALNQAIVILKVSVYIERSEFSYLYAPRLLNSHESGAYDYILIVNQHVTYLKP